MMSMKKGQGKIWPSSKQIWSCLLKLHGKQLRKFTKLTANAEPFFLFWSRFTCIYNGYVAHSISVISRLSGEKNFAK